MSSNYVQWMGMCLVVLMVCAGCGQSAAPSGDTETPSSQNEPASGADDTASVSIEDDGDQLTITSNEGTVTIDSTDDGGQMTITGLDSDLGPTKVETGTDLSLPAGFPEDVPTINGMTIVSVVTAGEAGMYTVNGTTTKDLDAAEAEIKEGATAGGWTSEASIEISADLMRQYQGTKDGRNLNVILVRESDVTNVTILVGRNEALSTVEPSVE